MTEPGHTNRLTHETSPYLRQHAHNPVDWYPWGDAAFQKAKAQDKPVFLSVGYSACHWCHVMAHESFENEETAAIMNEHFINIKVDREERPDIDEIYMNAVQLMTGSGGWPMSVFLTPDRVPFYGGTYFPPENRYGMPSFRQVLLSVARHFRENPGNIAQTATRMQERLIAMGQVQPGDGVPTADDFEQAYRKLVANFDPHNGGFGRQPKFPNAMNLEVLLREYARSGNPNALDMVTLALKKMACGGIFDQLGGGFHRYSVDDRWLVPHFEKMLYDNALLTALYTRAFQATRLPLFKRVVCDTLDYVMREMTHSEGGFYSTQDADSEGEEGKFFLWTPDEVEEWLGADDAALFCRYFDVSESGNFEGKNILNVPVDADALAKFLEIDGNRLQAAINRGRRVLFEKRASRIPPGKDEKIQTNWNGLMITAFALAYQVFGHPAHLDAASKAAGFALTRLRQPDGRLWHVFKDGQARFNGYQDDYACLIASLIDLYEATFDLSWLTRAIELTDMMIAQFWDDREGGFFFTGRDHETLIVRSKNPYDNAVPSGNSTGAMVLMRLGALTGREDYQKKADRIIRTFGPYLRELPSGFGHMLCALDFWIHGPIEIALLGDRKNPEAQTLLQTVYRLWLPNRVVCGAEGADSANAGTVPLLQGKAAVDGRATVYVCRNFACSAPVTDAGALEKMLVDGDFSQ